MKKPRVVLIDNRDSFTYNLVDYLRQLGVVITVFDNTTSVRQITKFRPDLVMYSPGPGNPNQAGKLLDYIDYFTSRLPQFGVCLGLQAMVEALGGSLRVLPKPVHGKASAIQHDGKTIFQGLPNPLEVGRYHSLAVARLPTEFAISAHTIDDQVIMAIRHQYYPMEAVQFHPESILTNPRLGLTLLRNMLAAL